MPQKQNKATTKILLITTIKDHEELALLNWEIYIYFTQILECFVKWKLSGRTRAQKNKKEFTVCTNSEIRKKNSSTIYTVWWNSEFLAYKCREQTTVE
jgi:hypothetical protein